jgi:hypothetical protein
MMSSFPGSPRLLKGGIVLLDPDTSQVLRVITLQYNPEMLTRTLQVKPTPPEAGDRLEALRLTGPAVETIKLDAEIDATDQLEFPDENPDTVQFGIYPQLAALEAIVHPSVSSLHTNNNLAQLGTIEITPVEAPLTVFVWSQQMVVPVRITDFSITEEFFDPTLNPIRAKVSLGLRVLSVNDLPFAHRGNSIFLAYLQQKERIAAKSLSGSLSALGISSIP